MLDTKGSELGRRGYPPDFRREVLDLVEASRTITEVARDLEISTRSTQPASLRAGAGGT